MTFRVILVPLAFNLFLLSQFQAVVACINTPAPPIKVGRPINLDTLGPQEYLSTLLKDRPTKGDWESALVDPETAKRNGLAPLSDNSRAVVLIHIGRTAEALEILKRLERNKPGSYYVAANMGTAYELLGDNEKCLQVDSRRDEKESQVAFRDRVASLEDFES